MKGLSTLFLGASRKNNYRRNFLEYTGSRGNPLGFRFPDRFIWKVFLPAISTCRISKRLVQLGSLLANNQKSCLWLQELCFKHSSTPAQERLLMWSLAQSPAGLRITKGLVLKRSCEKDHQNFVRVLLKIYGQKVPWCHIPIELCAWCYDKPPKRFTECHIKDWEQCHNNMRYDFYVYGDTALIIINHFSTCIIHWLLKNSKFSF